MTDHAVTRMRCAQLLALISGDRLLLAESLLLAVLANQDPNECDGPLPSPEADRTAPNTLADRDCDGTSAPSCRATGATSSGKPGPQTSGTSAKTSRDNAQVAAAGAPRGESNGARMFDAELTTTSLGVGGLVQRITTGRRGVLVRVGYHGVVSVVWDDTPQIVNDAMASELVGRCRTCLDPARHDGRCGCNAPDRIIAGVCIRCSQDVYEDEGWRFDDAGGRFHLHCFVASEVERDAQDFDLDAATAEADCIALEAVTGPAAVEWQPVPGEQVEVVEAVGSRTGPRRAIGKFVGYEQDERDPDGERWRLVEVYGVVRRFRAVGRVG